MKHDYRINLIKKELESLLSSYSVPLHLRNDPGAKEKEVEIIVKAINQFYPNDTNQEVISGSFERAELKIKASQMSRTWPKAADIVSAIKKSTVNDSVMTTKSADWFPDPSVIHAKRIKNGEPVSENYILGKLAEELIKNGLVTGEDLKPYRNALSSKKKAPTD
tara:strand:+ start:445 stop:936 length:492 start_codon:yes stop_codon:yes gene_type:complete